MFTCSGGFTGRWDHKERAGEVMTNYMKVCYPCASFLFNSVCMWIYSVWDHAVSWPPSCWPQLLWSSLLWAWTACSATSVPCSTKASPAPTTRASVCLISTAPAPGADTAQSTSCQLRAAWTLNSVAPMKSSLIGGSSTMSATPAVAKTNVTTRLSLTPTWGC